MDPFTIVLLAMLVFAVLLVAGIGRRPGIGEGRAPLLPRLVGGAALVGALLATVAAIVTIALTFIGDQVTLAIPVIVEVETVPDALRATPEASILSGTTYQSFVTLTVAGLDTGTRVLVATQAAVSTAVVVTVLVLIARIAQQSFAAEPFTQSLSRLLIGAGTALAIGAVLAQTLGTIAGARAHEQLFFLREGALNGVDNVSPYWTIDVWPIGVGVVLIVVARLIRNGERLQRDTRGLV